MNRITDKFVALKAKKEKAFIAYVTAGDPDLATTGRLVEELERRGADLVELGMPFSDPLADGPVIQRASERALLRGTRLPRIFALVRSLRRKVKIPLALLTYYNPVLKFGPVRFVRQAKAAGIDGVIVPDLPPEEGAELRAAAGAVDFSTIFLVAPTSTAARVKMISRASTGFIYCVSLTGVTGARSALPAELPAKIRQIRKTTDKPVAVGFGVSTPAQAAAVARIADGVIVGSAIVKVIESARGPAAAVKRVGDFVRPLVAAIKKAK